MEKLNEHQEEFDLIEFLNKVPNKENIDQDNQEVDLETKLREMLKLCEAQNETTETADATVELDEEHE